MEENEKTLHEEIVENNLEIKKEKSKTVNINIAKVFEILFYIIGIIGIIMAFIWYFSDLKIKYSGDPFDFCERQYVGGDAYNYIISASRSASVVIKSLIWMIFGCSFIIIGKLTAVINKLSCKLKREH